MMYGQCDTSLLVVGHHTTFQQKDVISMFPVLQGSAETLIQRCEKLYHLSVAYFLKVISAKNY